MIATDTTRILLQIETSIWTLRPTVSLNEQNFNVHGDRSCSFLLQDLLLQDLHT